MFSFVAWRGAEGRAGSGNSSALCPTARLWRLQEGSPRYWVSPKPEGYSVSRGMSCCPTIPVCSFPLSSSAVPFVQLILGGNEMRFSLYETVDFRVRQSFKGVQCEGFWVRCADVKKFTALTFVPHLGAAEAIKLTGNRANAMRARNQGTNGGRCWANTCTARGFASKFPGPQGFHRDPTLCEQSFGEGTWENFGWFYTAMSISDLSKQPRLCLEWMPLFVSCEMLALLSKCEWLLRLESKGELHHEARVDKRKNLFWVQDCSWEDTSLIFILLCLQWLLT